MDPDLAKAVYAKRDERSGDRAYQVEPRSLPSTIWPFPAKNDDLLGMIGGEVRGVLEGKSYRAGHASYVPRTIDAYI